MRTSYKLTAVVFFLTFLVSAGNGQKSGIDRQNENIRRARARLAEIDRLRAANTENISLSERELTLARNRIGAQREIVRGLEARSAQIAAGIERDSEQVRELDSTLVRLKKEYADFVYSAWKNQKLNTTTTFLLSSRDFNEATRRIAYIRRYNDARAVKGGEIDSIGRSLEAKIDTLTAARAALDILKIESSAEIAALRQQEGEYTVAITTLKQDRKTLDGRAKKERDKITAAQKQIDRIMAEEAAARKRRELSQAETAVSGRFEDNKGRLPWPVGGPGTVLNHFGTQRLGDGIVFNLSGIFIAATPGATIDAVFEGTVTKVYGVDQFERLVIVRSGHYMVVYGNLASTPLKVGDKVAVGQTVGTLSTAPDPDRHKLMLQIWNETTPLDPEQWLGK